MRHSFSPTTMLTLDEINAKIAEYISGLQYPYSPESLYAPIRYILSIGGKRIRPALMLMAYNMYKDDPERLLPQAAALETYHNFTLLHDDLMDKSDMRRGNPTVHKKWNENAAILSGDTMLVLAYKLFMNNEMQLSPVVAMDDFIAATLGVCEGQQYDIDFETRNNVTEEEYMEMIRMKTSLLLGYALKIGAKLAGASEADCKHLYDFGEKMGIAFQLQDDLLDVYGDTRFFKKKLGADIVDNKKTYLLINAFSLANDAQRKELEHWIGQKDFREDEKIAAVTRIYDEIGIAAITQNKIEEIFAESLEHLSKVSVTEEKKVNLYAFANRLLGRKF